MNIWTINGDKKYTISYSQPVEEYPTYLGIVQHTVDSFEITRVMRGLNFMNEMR